MRRRRASRGLPIRPLARPLAALICLLSVAACASPPPGEPELPPGFVERGMPDVDINAYVYAAAATPVDVAADAFGGAPDARFHVRFLEATARAVGREYGVLVAFETPEMASAAADLVRRRDAGQLLRWVGVTGSQVQFGQAGTGWGEDLQRAWDADIRARVETRYPGAWDTLRLLPSDAPGEPLAAGFVRDAAVLIDEVSATVGLTLEGLDSALSLVRVDTLAFGVYGPTGLAAVPARPTADEAGRLGMGLLAVGRAGYPGAIVGFLLSRYAGLAGLLPMDLNGGRGWQRRVGDLHLVVVHTGPVVYLALAADPEQARSLLEAALADRRAPP